MNEEIIRILDMVKSGTITVEEGEKLIAAISDTDKEENMVEVITQPTKKKGRMLRVRVYANEGRGEGSVKVNVNLPLGIAKSIVKLINVMPQDVNIELEKEGINLKDIDLPGLIEAFEQGEIGEELVNIEAGDGEDKVVVKVYVD